MRDRGPLESYVGDTMFKRCDTRPLMGTRSVQMHMTPVLGDGINELTMWALREVRASMDGRLC
jgi:hypothetical protein